MKVTIRYHHEADGRWFAEIRKFPGVMAYGSTRVGAKAAVLAVAREVAIAEMRDREPTGGVINSR